MSTPLIFRILGLMLERPHTDSDKKELQAPTNQPTKVCQEAKFTLSVFSGSVFLLGKTRAMSYIVLAILRKNSTHAAVSSKEAHRMR